TLQVPGRRKTGLRSPLISDTTSQSGDECGTQASPNITLESVVPLQSQTIPQLSRVTERSLSLHSVEESCEQLVSVSREDYEILCSASDEVTVLRVQVDLLQDEINSLNQYQSRLEEDFHASQQMLEEREAEIRQLNEEVEDSVHTPPLISETRMLQQRCEEYARQ
ncbi:unnamed protein product, partial [Meganyctiphanes norvegica]